MVAVVLVVARTRRGGKCEPAACSQAQPRVSFPVRIIQPASPAQPRQPADFRVKFSSSRPGPGPSPASPAQPRQQQESESGARSRAAPSAAAPRTTTSTTGTTWHLLYNTGCTGRCMAAMAEVWPGYGHYGHQMTDGHTPHSILTPDSCRPTN